MTNVRQIIEHIKEPTVLYLMWQDADRDRHHVGNLYPDRFEYLDKNDLPDNFEGFPAFSIKKKVHEGNVLSVFLTRCPQRERTSYEKFLNSFALDPKGDEVKNLSDFMLLGYTGVYIPSDSFHLINPFKEIEPPFEFVIRMAGVHNYYSNFDNLEEKEGEALSLELEPSNEKDPKAIKINFKGEKLGYVQKGINNSFHDWINKKYKIDLSIYRVNGSKERRYVYAFVKIRN